MADPLVANIRDGTFPESNDILGQRIDAAGISSLLKSLADSKVELEKEIRDVSQTAAGDVDEWISQAKKVQEDIARCKVEARHIVEEHQRGELLRNTFKEANVNVQLLETEVAFTKALEHEIQSVSEITRVIGEGESDLLNENPVEAVRKVISLRAAIATISATQTRSLLSQLETELHQTCQRKLEAALRKRWSVQRNKSEDVLTIYSDQTLGKDTENHTTSMTIDGIMNAFQELEASPSAVTVVASIIDSFIKSILSSSSLYPSSAEVKDDNLVITRLHHEKNTRDVLSVLQAVLEFVHTRLPQQIHQEVAQKFLPTAISVLISQWLDLALPHDLHDLQELKPLQEKVLQMATQLQSFSWPGHDALKDWMEQIPRGWLAKRRAASLDAVRKAFQLARGTLRPVERTERQSIVTQEANENDKQPDDDWNTDWENDTEQMNADSKVKIDEETSGWDFDTEEVSSPAANRQVDTDPIDEEDAGDAWGWGEDENDEDDTEQPKSLPRPQTRQVNGNKAGAPKTQEMVLTETYHITDIPDHILESIGKDMIDSHELQGSATKYFNTTSPATGLTGLPNLVLALFRATAPTYYSLPSATYTLSNINLYNDTLYIVQKLGESPDSSHFESSVLSLTKFARQVYSAELDVQRTILTDLLDGAQGFDRCTTFPNSQACIDAVSSTVDRVRQLHKDWSSILGESHLLQSLGSLMTMIFGKIIKDIEDMDDISEAESKQLVTFCQQILSLEDLFSSRLPNLTHSPNVSHEQLETGSSQILLYVPNYLRFQYLQQILDSSLVDIKYLWTEGELSLEFSVEEVVDLITALFAESQHRRNAIRTIRGSTVG